MASPYPLPSAQKAARGNPGRRPLPKAEPKPSQVLPPAPDWLKPFARQAWDSLIPELLRIGVITAVDHIAFARYCQNLADWNECRLFLAEHGPDLTTFNEDGKVSGVVPYPHTRRKMELEKLLLTYEREFGLTPSARSRINAAPTPEVDELDALLAAPMRIAK